MSVTLLVEHHSVDGVAYFDRVESDSIADAFVTLETNLYQGLGHPFPNEPGLHNDRDILIDLTNRGYSITFLPGDDDERAPEATR